MTEQFFHPDSYGYRPGRGAHDALAAARKRCWEYDWAVEFDIRKFFDSVPWDLIVRAVEALRLPPWVLLYVRRWLAAPVIMPDGEERPGDRGTPQGSAVSPVIANLFLHWAFDMWMDREFPDCPFERYADDGLIHCESEARACQVLAALELRDGGSRPAAAPGEDQDHLLQGRQPAWPVGRAGVLRLPGIYLPAPLQYGEERQVPPGSTWQSATRRSSG